MPGQPGQRPEPFGQRQGLPWGECAARADEAPGGWSSRRNPAPCPGEADCRAGAEEAAGKDGQGVGDFPRRVLVRVRRGAGSRSPDCAGAWNNQGNSSR